MNKKITLPIFIFPFFKVIFTLLIMATAAYAQAPPEGINYQAIARNNTGNGSPMHL